MSQGSLVTERGFWLHTFSCEIQKIGEILNEDRHGEHQGDLFGMWTNFRCAVVYVVLGEQKATREPTSRRAGRARDVRSVLREEYKLCHIGKWFFSPQSSGATSSGQQIAKKHCRVVSEAACVILNATIFGGKYKLAPYLFDQQRHDYKLGTLNVLPGLDSGQSGNNVNPFGEIPCLREMPARVSFERILEGPGPATAVLDTIVEVLDELRLMVDDPTTVTLDHNEGHSTDYIIVEFQINQNNCQVVFPKSFDAGAARIEIHLPQDHHHVEIKRGDAKLDETGRICDALETCRSLSCQISGSTSTTKL